LVTFTITACRTTFPGLETPQIPIELANNSQTVLTSLPDDGRWWKAGGPTRFGQLSTAGIEYFVSRLNEPNDPACVSNKKHPSCVEVNGIQTPNCLNSGSFNEGGPNGGGVDYYPYIFSPGNLGQIVISTNNDFTANWFGVYDPSLGQPGYGVATFDNMGNLLAAFEWCGSFGPALTNAGGNLACSRSDWNSEGGLCGYDSTSVPTNCTGMNFKVNFSSQCKAVYTADKLKPRTRVGDCNTGQWIGDCAFNGQNWTGTCISGDSSVAGKGCTITSTDLNKDCEVNGKAPGQCSCDVFANGLKAFPPLPNNVVQPSSIGYYSVPSQNLCVTAKPNLCN
jgi:hypothetical protein